MCRRDCVASFLSCTVAAFFALVASAAEDDRPNHVSWPAWADASGDDAQVRPVTERETRSWTRWLAPLPKQIRWAGKVVMNEGGGFP